MLQCSLLSCIVKLHVGVTLCTFLAEPVLLVVFSHVSFYELELLLLCRGSPGIYHVLVILYLTCTFGIDGSCESAVTGKDVK